MRKIFSLFILCSILLACKNDSTSRIEILPSCQYPINFEPDFVLDHQRVLSCKPSDTLFYRFNDTCIQVFDLRTGQETKQITVPQTVSQFSLMSDSEIVLLSKGKKCILILNVFTLKVDTVYLPESKDIFKGYEVTFGLPRSQSQLPIIVDDRLLFKVNPEMPKDFNYSSFLEKIYNNSPLDLVYDFNKKEFSITALKNMSSSFRRKERLWNGLEHGYSRAYNPTEKNLVYSFAMNDTLFVVEKNGQIKRKCVRSEYFIDFPPPTAEDMKMVDEPERFATITPRYSNIFYNQWKKNYYRIAYHSQKLEAPDGTPNTQTDNDWSVIVLDENLDLIEEVFFRGGEYRIGDFLVMPAGLLVSNENTKNKYRNGKISSYSLFTLPSTANVLGR